MVGILIPNIFHEAFIVGVCFEMFEYFMYKCHDPLDIIWNVSGYVIGAQIGKRIQ